MAVLQGPSRPIGYDTKGNPVFSTTIEKKGDKLYQSPTWFGTPPPAQYSGGQAPQNLSGTGGVSWGGFGGSSEYFAHLAAVQKLQQAAEEKAKQDEIRKKQEEARLSQERFQQEEAARQAYQKQLNEARTQEQRNLAIANFNEQQRKIQRQEIESRIKSGISKSYTPSSSYGSNYTLGYSSGESITPSSFYQQGTSGIPSNIIQIPGGTGIPKTKPTFRDTGTIITTPRKPNVPEYATKTSVMLGQERYPTLEELKQTYEWSYVKPYKTGNQYKTRDLANVYTFLPTIAEKTANLLRKVPAIRKAEQKVQSYGLSSGGLGIANRAQGLFSSAVTTSGPFILFSPLMSTAVASQQEENIITFMKKRQKGLLLETKPQVAGENIIRKLETTYIKEGKEGVDKLLKELVKKIAKETDPIRKSIAENNLKEILSDLSSKGITTNLQLDLLTGRIKNLVSENKPVVDLFGVPPVQMEGMSYLGFGVPQSSYQGSQYGIPISLRQQVEEVKQKSRFNLGAFQDIFTRSSTGLSVLSQQTTVQQPRTEQQLKTEQGTLQFFVPAQASKTEQKTKTQQRFGSFSFVGEKTINPQKNKSGFLFPFWDMNRRKKKEEISYDAYVLRESTKPPKKKWEMVGQQLPRITALSYAGEEVDKSISARFKLVPNPAEPQDIVDKGWNFIKHKFRAFSQRKGSKTPLPSGNYIERQKFRADMPREVSRLQSSRRASDFLIGSMRQQPRTRRKGLFRL